MIINMIQESYYMLFYFLYILKTFNSDFPYTQEWNAHQSSKPLGRENKINITIKRGKGVET